MQMVIPMETHFAKLPERSDGDVQPLADAAVHSGQRADACGGLTESVLRTAPLLEKRAERLVIEETVAQVFGVAECDLRRATRGQARVARARQVAMYLAHVVCGMSLTEVGRTFARDRTTVSHACGVIEDGRDDPTFDRVLELLEQVVNAVLNARTTLGSRRDWLFQ